MTKRGITVAILALLAAPVAAHAGDAPAPNLKFPETDVTAPLVPKSAAPEARISHACALGQVGGVALGFMLGSGRAWDALTDTLLGHPPSAEQRAYCALGEALAPLIASAAESVAQEAWVTVRRQAETVQEMMAAGSAQTQQAVTGFLTVTAEKSAGASSDLARFCEGHAPCAWLRDATANTWSRFWPMR